MKSVFAENAKVLRDVAAMNGVAYSIALASDDSVLVGSERGQLARLVAGE